MAVQGGQGCAKRSPGGHSDRGWRHWREVTINGQSEIVGDEACSVVYQSNLSIILAKWAFFDSQKMDDAAIEEVDNTDDIAELDYGEFLECLARCGRSPQTGTQGASQPALGVSGGSAQSCGCNHGQK